MGTTKRERHKQGRQQRLEAQVAALKRQRSRRRVQAIAILGVVLVVVTLLIAGVGRNKNGDKVSTASEKSTTTEKATSSTTEKKSTTTSTPASTTTIAENPTTAALRKELSSGTPCPSGTVSRKTTFSKPPQLCIDPEKTYTAKVETSRGSFTVQFDAKAAPVTVNNFVFLSRYHFYDGVTFHRIIPGFVVQGGDPQGTGMGGPGYQFKDELPAGNTPYYQIGSLAMANSGPNTNGSQFFIVTGADGANLPPNYSRFGTVTGGIATVRSIEKTGTPDGKPTSTTKITRVTITES